MGEPVRLSAQYLLCWVEQRETGLVVLLDDRGTVVEISAAGSPPERAAMGCMRVVTAVESYTTELLKQARHPVAGPNVAIVGHVEETG
jgi:hypothetical protein